MTSAGGPVDGAVILRQWEHGVTTARPPPILRPLAATGEILAFANSHRTIPLRAQLMAWLRAFPHRDSHAYVSTEAEPVAPSPPRNVWS